jgi:hypothetical protein
MSPAAAASTRWANSPVHLLRLVDQRLGDNGASAESLELEDYG